MVDKEIKNIALIGFMATGKTSVGMELARSLDLNFIDLDEAIEKKEAKTISQIFKLDGEKHFRDLEKKSLEEVAHLEDLVISCGGGVCLDPENIRKLKKKNKIILLEASLEDIIERTSKDKTRPLLGDGDKKKAIQYLMNKRRGLYLNSADIIINTSGKDICQVRDEIIKRLEGEKD